MGSTVGLRRATGSVTATNASLTIRCGFQPKKIKVSNRTNQCQAEWDDKLAALSADVRIADGTLSMPTTNGFSQVAGDSSNPAGFSIGALANINDTTTETLHWEAWGY